MAGKLAALALAFAGCVEQPAPVGQVEEGLTTCAAGPTVRGVDVSHYEGTIDWGAVKAGGVDFAIMKATEGLSFVDPTFSTNWAGAGAAHVVRGAYHFFRPEDDPVAQADFFVQTAGLPAPGDLPPTIDLEVTDNVAVAQVAAGALAFMVRVKQKTGRTPIVYTSVRVFDGLLGGPSGYDSYPLWVANYGVTCPNIPNPPWARWTIWQTSGSGTVAGISGTTDVDLFNGTLADLMAFTTPTSDHDAGTPDAGQDLDSMNSSLACSVSVGGQGRAAPLLGLAIGLGLGFTRRRRAKA